MKTLLVCVAGFACLAQAETKLEVTSALGTKFYSLPDEKGVVAAAEKALAADPRNPALFLKLALAQASVWEDREAVETCTRGLAVAPDRADLLIERGHRELPLRQFDMAKDDLARAVKLDPKQTEGWYHLGLAHYFTGEFGQAGDAFQHAVETAPDLDGRINATNWVYASYRRAGKADEAAKAAARITPEMKEKAPHTLHYLNLVRLFQGRKTESEILPPEPPAGNTDTEAELLFDTVGYGIGNWHLFNGHPEKAREYFARVAKGHVWVTWGFIAAEQAVAAGGPDWSKVNRETLLYYQAAIRMDTTSGGETKLADYVAGVLDANGIPATVVAKEAGRGNVIARLKGNGSKKPLLIMGHLDTVKVDPAKWKFPPFSAQQDGGYVYGRGTLDDKDNLTASLMTMLLLKRSAIPLDRDVIFVAEAGEEGNSAIGAGFLVNEHWSEIEAEICLAEGGTVVRRGGQARYALIQTTEKIPAGARLVAHGPAGHGSRPMRTNAILHLTRAVEKIAMWDPPMRFNDTTRYYFEKLGTVSTPEEAARYNALFDPAKAAAAREYLAEHEPGQYSMLHTSISPNIINGGYQSNVIPSEATATLDIRALPDENMPAFYELMRKVIDDPAVEVVANGRGSRTASAPSRIDSEAFHAIEAANQRIYGTITLPQMSTGATDMSYLRSRGVQCYGIGPMVDEEDAAKGFGAHSDQERLLEDALYKFVRFNWEVVTSLAAKK
jgi:acetylornithine deacetylase/succinyl-diaminopimelate desuccinylase-like protein